MKKFISLLLTMILVLSLCVTSFAQMSDVENHWAKEAISYLVEKGVLSGYPDGTFKPDNPMSKAEFYKVINKLLGFEEKAEVPYYDVFPKDWFYDHVAKALAAGYITPATLLSPNENITRQEVARIIGVVYNIDNTSTSAMIFSDSSIISEEISGYIGTMVDQGILSGYPDGTFRPNTNITRAEVVTIINNVLKNLEDIVKIRVDKSELQALIEETLDLDKNDYTETTWNKLKDVLESAIKIYENENATQDEVDEILDKLEEKIESLKKRIDEPEIPQPKMTASPANFNKDSNFSQSLTFTIVNDTILDRVYFGDVVLGGAFEGLNIEWITTINNKTFVVDIFGDLNKIGTGTITLKGRALKGGIAITAKVSVNDLPEYVLKLNDPNIITEPMKIAPTEIIGDVEINYEPHGDLELCEGLEIRGNLTVNAPNATVINHAKVSGEIIIRDVSSNSWKEYADGNRLVIEDENGLALEIFGNISGITVSESADGYILVYISEDSNVDTIESIVINKPIILYLLEKPVKAVIKEGIKVEVYSTRGPYIYAVRGTGQELELVVPSNMVRTESINITTETGEDNVMVGETLQMLASVSPENASFKQVLWSVENVSGSATIDSSGLLTATGAGRVIVIAKALDNLGVYSEKEITIEEARIKVTGITLDKSSMIMGVGEDSVNLYATLYPSDATIKNIIWTASNDSIARVVSDGLRASVQPKGVGTATITAATLDGGFIATCEVEVRASHTLTLIGYRVTSNPPQGKILDRTLVTLTLSPAEGQLIESVLVNDSEEKDNLIDNKYSFEITGDTTVKTRIKLAQAQKPYWDGHAIRWNDVDDAKWYLAYIYKDDVLQRIEQIYHLGFTQTYYDCESIINEVGLGSYTVGIQAMGDMGDLLSNGDESEHSDALILEAIEIKGYDEIPDIIAGRVGSEVYNLTDVLATLPTNINILGTSVSVPVTWSEVSEPEYNPEKAGTYIFTGTIGELPMGYVDDIDTISKVYVNVIIEPKQYTLTLTGARVSSNPAPGLIDEGTEVTVTVSLEDGQSIVSFKVNGSYRTNLLVRDENTYTYTFTMVDDTTIHSYIKLAQVSKPTWTGTVINWDPVDDVRNYAIALYKDGNHKSTTFGDADSVKKDMSSEINRYGTGEYTVCIRANGDITDILYGEFSPESDVLLIENDYSGFNVVLANEEPKNAGEEFDLRITEAKELLGNYVDLYARIVTVTSNIEGEIFNNKVSFNNGVPYYPIIKVKLEKPGEHILTVQIECITNSKEITVIVE